MKRFVTLSTAAFLLSVTLPLTVQAQMGQGIDIKPGVRAGVDFMTLGGDDADNELGRRTGFLVGGFVLVDISGPIAIQPELMYLQKGASDEETFDGTTITSTTKLDYIEVPFLAKLQVPLEEGISPNLFVGPTLGINVAAEAEVEGGGESETQDISDNVSGTEFGLTLGGGIDINLSDTILTGDIRYGIGLTSIDESDDLSINNQGFMITAGFALAL